MTQNQVLVGFLEADASVQLAVIKQQHVSRRRIVFYTLEFSRLLAAIIPFTLRNLQRDEIHRVYHAEPDLLVC